jgi:hypothetical protein
MEINMPWGEVLTIIGVNVALIYWLRQDSKDFMNKIETWKEEINKEMKDFHIKLATQDLEFKMRIAAIEEKKQR